MTAAITEETWAAVKAEAGPAAKAVIPKIAVRTEPITTKAPELPTSKLEATASTANDKDRPMKE